MKKNHIKKLTSEDSVTHHHLKLKVQALIFFPV